MINHTQTQSHYQASGHRKRSLALGLALSYSVFLLVCLVLGVFLYMSAARNARETFWQERTVQLERAIDEMDSYIGTLDSFVNRLFAKSTFVRLTNMKSMGEYGFMMTAYHTKLYLADMSLGPPDFPVTNYGIYLKNIGYIISGSQFTEADQYYRMYRRFTPGMYEAWRDTLLKADRPEHNIDISAYTGSAGTTMFVRDMDAFLPRSVPAVIWFEWDKGRLEALFMPEEFGNEACLRAVDERGQVQLNYGQGAHALAALTFDENGISQQGDDYAIERFSARTGWVYRLSMPQALLKDVLGDYDSLFGIILAAAALAGTGLVTLLVKRNMRPIRLLGSELEKAEGDRQNLLMQMDTQRPAVCAAYLRQLLSGHISSGQEYDYIMRYLHLEGHLYHYVLYGAAYNQNPRLNAGELQEAVSHALNSYLTTDYPLYFYTSLSNNYIALVTFDEKTLDPLMALQARVMALHDRLLSEEGIWFYAGVGRMCSQPLNLWEAYEQARTALRYTTKQHIFLPYEVMKKDTQAVYYPIEISAKLLHFITSGNRAQVVELFGMLYQENVKERSLPVNRLNFLLSDLRNTLLKARFSLPDTQAEDEALDTQLNGEATFALLENAALALCERFRETAEPGNPVPDIERYLNENYTDPSMCLSKLSDVFRISESYLSHLFKERTGKNFSVYLEDLRLFEAERRLKDRQCDLSSLYLDVGYNNAVSFRRAFKKRFGMTPSAMREK